MAIKAVLFDADNTLYKLVKENAYEEKFSYLEKETGIKKEKIREKWENIKNFLVRTEKKTEKRTREYSTNLALMQLGVEPKRAHELTKACLRIFWKRIMKDIAFDKDVRKTIQYLKQNYKIVITSEGFSPNLRERLDTVFIDWRKYFNFIIGPEKTGEMKPSKKYYETALKKLRIKPEEAIVIGDSWEKDMKPAKEL